MRVMQMLCKLKAFKQRFNVGENYRRCLFGSLMSVLFFGFVKSSLLVSFAADLKRNLYWKVSLCESRALGNPGGKSVLFIQCTKIIMVCCAASN